jgi:hypothetical protein
MIHYNTPSQHRRRIISLYIIRSQHRLPIQYTIRCLRRRHMRPIITITAARCIRTKSMFLVIMALLPGLLAN